MAAFRALHLRRFVEHPGRSLLSLIGIAVGSLLVVALIGVVGSLTGSVESIATLAAGADVEAQAGSDAGMPTDVADAVRSTPGVARSTPIVRSAVVVEGHDALLLGADPGSEGQTAGVAEECFAEIGPPRVLEGGTPVVVGPALARRTGATAGSHLDLFGAGTTTRIVVLGVLDCDQARSLNGGMFLATTLPVAQQLSGRPDRIDAVFATAADGVRTSELVDRIQSAVGDRAVVASPTLRARLAAQSLKPLQQGMLTAISLAIVVAGFLVFNTMSMAALERRKELATLRAVGGRRRTLLVGFMAEAALLGVVGSAAGALAGIVAARVAVGQVPTIFLDFLGVEPTFRLPASAVPAGIAVGVLATLVAAWFPARAAVRVAPVEAMRPEGVLEASGPGRTSLKFAVPGALVFVGGSLLSVLGTGASTLPGFAAITLGTVVGSYGATGPLARAVARVASLFGRTGRLAAAGIERSPRRVWATTLAVTVAVGVVVALGGVTRNQARSFGADFEPLADTDLWLQTTSVDTIPVQPRLPAEWLDELAAVPGVAAVIPNQAAYLTLDDEQVLIEGEGRGTNVPFYRHAEAVHDRLFAGEGIVISKNWADRRGLDVGDEIELSTPSGLQRAEVLAVVDLPVVVQGQLGVDYDRFNRWFGRTALSGIEIDIADGADVATVTEAVRAVVADSPVPVNVVTGEEQLAGAQESLRQSLAIFNATLGVVVAASALAILNTMAIAVVERRRELGILRAIGTSRRTIRTTVVIEAVAITAVGMLTGIALGLVQHRVGVEAITSLAGFTVDYAFVVAPVTVAVVASALMAVVGATGPAWRAGKVEIVEAIGYE